jgi:hypothetical protein
MSVSAPLSTFSRTNSAAISAWRSSRPSAQRYSIVTVRFSIRPSSRSSRTKKRRPNRSRLKAWPTPRSRSPAASPAAARAPRAAARHRAAEQSHELASPHGLPSSGWAPHATAPLSESPAMHRSKIDRRMAAQGQTRPRRPPPRFAYARPVLPSKRTHAGRQDRGRLGPIAAIEDR